MSDINQLLSNYRKARRGQEKNEAVVLIIQELASKGRFGELALWPSALDNDKSFQSQLRRNIGSLPEKQPWRITSAEDLKKHELVDPSLVKSDSDAYVFFLQELNSSKDAHKKLKHGAKSPFDAVTSYMQYCLAVSPEREPLAPLLSVAVMDFLEFVILRGKMDLLEAHELEMQNVKAEQKVAAEDSENSVLGFTRFGKLIREVGGKELLHKTYASVFMFNGASGGRDFCALIFSKDAIFRVILKSYSLEKYEITSQTKLPGNQFSKVSIIKYVNTHLNGERQSQKEWTELEFVNSDGQPSIHHGKFMFLESSNQQHKWVPFVQNGIAVSVEEPRQTTSGKAYQESHFSYGVGIGYID